MIHKILSTISALLMLPFLLAGCSGMTKPEDIAVATELCAMRGGFASVKRYERGKTLTINCKDGLHIEVRLHEVKP